MTSKSDRQPPTGPRPEPTDQDAPDTPDEATPEQTDAPTEAPTEAPDTTGITTRADLKGRAPEPDSGDAVSLTSPDGTRVTVTAEAAEELRGRGYT